MGGLFNLSLWIINQMDRFQYRVVLFLLLSAFLFSSAFAFDAVDIEASGLNMGIGYRSDQFDWNISGDVEGGNPNILSELSWDDIDIYQLQVAIWLKLGELPFLKRNSLVLANISFGKIMSGNVRDSDYATDDRNNEWSRSINDANEGLTFDLSGAFGPIFKLNNVIGVSITPLVGYGFNMQALTMTNGNQDISEPDLSPAKTSDPPDIGSFPDLDSSYTAYWYGPWLGVNIDYQGSDQFSMTVGVEYHWVEYFAQADWNLRSDFAHPVSFEHESTGTGLVWNIQSQYMFNDQWSWLFSGKIQNWETESGSDRTFFAVGTVGLSRLNEVNWSSYALTTGVQYRF